MQALKSAVLFLLLARYNNEQSDLMHRIYEEKQLQHIPLYRWVFLYFPSHAYMYIQVHVYVAIYMGTDHIASTIGNFHW